jgi:hypothetical protein
MSSHFASTAFTPCLIVNSRRQGLKILPYWRRILDGNDCHIPPDRDLPFRAGCVAVLKPAGAHAAQSFEGARLRATSACSRLRQPR